MSSTNFLNSKKRRIMLGSSGGFFSNVGGKKVYGIKAAFRKVGSGSITKIANHEAVPVAIRSKMRGAVIIKKSPVMATSTNFLNSNFRRIMQGHRGGFYANSNGKKVYGIKASFRKVGSGGVTKISNHKSVPSPIRRSHKVSMRLFKRKNPFAALMKMKKNI